MGKTRIAREVAAMLAAHGRKVSWIRPGEGPFSALVPLVGSLGAFDQTRADLVRQHVRETVEQAIAAGNAFVIDDANLLDRPSARLLAAISQGPFLHVSSRRGEEDRGADAILAPLSVTDLEGLFAGSNRLFHLREDAARELHRRTNGVPARIAGEVRAWTRTGLARRVLSAARRVRAARPTAYRKKGRACLTTRLPSWSNFHSTSMP